MDGHPRFPWTPQRTFRPLISHLNLQVTSSAPVRTQEGRRGWIGLDTRQTSPNPPTVDPLGTGSNPSPTHHRVLPHFAHRTRWWWQNDRLSPKAYAADRPLTLWMDDGEQPFGPLVLGHCECLCDASITQSQPMMSTPLDVRLVSTPSHGERLLWRTTPETESGTTKKCMDDQSNFGQKNVWPQS